ncbi:MAG: hypothetical protein VKM34_12685 [Cyanobacteriota bacterium]|nr:hypothetical protein [Cyanobacteriota bacterium]
MSIVDRITETGGSKDQSAREEMMVVTCAAFAADCAGKARG